MVDAKYSKFIGDMEELVATGDLLKQRNEDSRSDKKDEAGEALKNYAINHAPDVERAGLGRLRYNDELIDGRIHTSRAQANERAGNNLHANLESIVGDMPGACLENLIKAKEIFDKIEAGDDKELANKYSSYKKIFDFYDRFSSGRELSDEERDFVVKAAARGYADKEEENAKNSGEKYSRQVLDMVKTCAVNAVNRGMLEEKKINEYAKPGLEAMRDEKKKDYDDAVTRIGYDIHPVVRKAVKALAKGTAEEFEAARQLIYRADKGKL